MVDQLSSYLFTKRGIYYFSRRIPKDVQGHFKTTRLMLSLRTKTHSRASKLAEKLSETLEDEWWQIRRHHAQSALTKYLGRTNQSLTPSDYPTLSECKSTYLTQKGERKNKTFHQTTERAVGTVIKLCGDLPADQYSKKDALTLRNHFKSKGLTVATSKRMFAVIKAVMNFATAENGLELSNPFARVFLGEDQSTQSRQPIPAEAIKTIQRACAEIDDERRWLVALLSDSGLRLSEALGLTVNDIHLDQPVPHLVIKPHPWRPLKTRASERIVPLVGASFPRDNTASKADTRLI